MTMLVCEICCISNVEYSQQNNRGKFATEILSIIKDSDRENSLGKLKEYRLNKHFDYKADEYILQTVTSSFTMKDLVCTQDVREEFEYFIKERQQTEALVQMDIPVSNKILLHGPSGCGKTLSAYVLAGELSRPLIIVNLGTIISSRLGETSKNLTQIFKTAVQEKAIVLLDEFDSLGKIRDYDQDHGEMKRVVNTILQLFDFVSQDTIIIAATNQLQMIDEALLEGLIYLLRWIYQTLNRYMLLSNIRLKIGSSLTMNKSKKTLSIANVEICPTTL